MKNLFKAALTAVMAIAVLFNISIGNAQEWQVPKPMVQVVQGTLQPMSTSSTLEVPVITWGADLKTILAEQQGIFAKEGLTVHLFKEDNFVKQVEMVLQGRTPLLRGTLDMMVQANEVFRKYGTELVVVYQLSWSAGGDWFVGGPRIRKPSDMQSKTILLQLYGPHMYYAGKLVKDARIPFSSVTFRYLPEITVPTFDTGGKILDPVSAFAQGIGDGVFCIMLDGLHLTSNNTVGDGGEGSRKGARMVLSTKTAPKIIPDVYAFRKDFFDANKSTVMAFVKAEMLGDEALRDLVKVKGRENEQFEQRVADVIFGSPTAVNDAKGLIGDIVDKNVDLAGFDQNVQFFTDKVNTRAFSKIVLDMQDVLSEMKFLTTRTSLAQANWDYNSFRPGLKNASAVSASAPAAPTKKFDENRVAQAAAKKIETEPTSWEEEGTLFVVEIKFGPNEETFSPQQYADDFQLALEKAQTYEGALITVEGHSDPLGVRKQEKKARESGSPTDKALADQMKQVALNLSLTRSQAVKASFIKYCKAHGLTVNETQFVPIGMGIKAPLFDPPRTEEEWKANRRVVFRIKQVEAEASAFSPVE